MASLAREDVVAFLTRPWRELRTGKERHWATLRRRKGAAAALEAAHALRLHMQEIRRSWPSALERRADLQEHVRLSRLLRRIGRALAKKSDR